MIIAYMVHRQRRLIVSVRNRDTDYHRACRLDRFTLRVHQRDVVQHEFARLILQQFLRGRVILFCFRDRLCDQVCAFRHRPGIRVQRYACRRVFVINIPRARFARCRNHRIGKADLLRQRFAAEIFSAIRAIPIFNVSIFRCRRLFRIYLNGMMRVRDQRILGNFRIVYLYCAVAGIYYSHAVCRDR